VVLTLQAAKSPSTPASRHQAIAATIASAMAGPPSAVGTLAPAVNCEIGGTM